MSSIKQTRVEHAVKYYYNENRLLLPLLSILDNVATTENPDLLAASWDIIV